MLDHDHYLDWFLSSLEAASIKVLPVWLLMLGVYWDGILRYRKRGKRLAEILLEKRRQVMLSKQVEFLQPLIDRLSNSIKRLLRENTSCVVLPDSWDNYRDTLASCLDLDDRVDRAIFRSLAERNARVQRPKDSPGTAQRSRRQLTIHILDSVRSTHDINSTSTACLDAIEDRAALVSTLLEWTACVFRHGVFRVFTGVRLLRKWKACGIDINSHILAFLAQAGNSSGMKMCNVYHVISELVRSQTFSVGRYLQWLMARGATDRVQSNKSKTITADVGLLAHLPVSRLPEHVRNLRYTLMARAGFSASEESLMLQIVKNSISHRFPKIFGAKPEATIPQNLSKLNLTWTVKSEIGQWIRRGVAEHYHDAARANNEKAFPAEDVSALTPEEFYGIRDILESFGDLSILADVLRNASDSDDATVLAAAADTLNYHYDAFCPMGATTDLFRRFVQAYVRLKNFGTSNLDFIFSLIELGLRMPGEFNTVALLRQELSRLENKSSMTAFSPVSDCVPDATTEGGSPCHEKLDQLLSSGNGMDEATLGMVFNTLTKQLESGHNRGTLSASDTCRYLARLRLFLPKHFDLLLVRWVCTVLKSPTRPALSKVLPPLIGVGCVTIQAFLSLLRSLSQREETVSRTIPNMPDLQMDLLELLVPIEPGQDSPLDLVSYRFRLAQQDYLLKHPEEVLGIIRDTAVSLNGQHTPMTESRQNDFQHRMTTLLVNLLIRNPECAPQKYMQYLDQNAVPLVALQKALDHSLGLGLQVDQTIILLEVEKIISVTSDFSLPFCQLRLQILFNAESDEEVKNSIVDAMFKVAKAGARARNPHWVDLVSVLGQDAVRQIRERAEKEFLSISLSEDLTDGRATTAADSQSPLEIARVHLTIIDALSYSIPETGLSSIAPALVEKMDMLFHKLAVQQANFSSFTRNANGVLSGQTAGSHCDFEKSLAFWFSALLRMIVIHRSAFNTPSLVPRPNCMPEQTRLLVSIFCIALSRLPSSLLRLFPIADYFPHQPVQSRDFRPCPGILLHTHALDVAASLIDAFPEEIRLQCARFLKEKCPPFLNFQNDPRFVYLLGPVVDLTPANAAQPMSVPSPAASGSTPAATPSINPQAGSPAQQPVGSFPWTTAGLSEGPSYTSSHLHIQYRGRNIGPFPLRPWELIEDASPFMGANDTAVGLGYFDARRVKS
ncbi:hypothetical protein MAP00_008228 [Monascus purpureus]|nr:hypothetical protein MAP00_008228 [Monascus purpureus]